MSFWQENYQFIKEVYDMRHMKMAEWMENVEKSISRIMADKVYTSAEFKRERDTFNVRNPARELFSVIILSSFSLSAKTWSVQRSRNGWPRSWRSSWLSAPRTRRRTSMTNWTSSSRSTRS